MAILQVNGKNQEIGTLVSLIEIMKRNDVTKPEMVSIRVNGEFVDRGNSSSLLVHAGDEVDFLYFMGGGSRC